MTGKRFGKIFNREKTQDELAIEAGLEKMQGLQNLRNPMGGTEIEQRKPIEQIKRATPPPYDTEYLADKNYGKPKNERSLEEANNDLNNAYRTQQLKDLEDAESIGEFEEADSASNQKAKKLRALLGM